MERLFLIIVVNTFLLVPMYSQELETPKDAVPEAIVKKVDLIVGKIRPEFQLTAAQIDQLKPLLTKREIIKEKLDNELPQSEKYELLRGEYLGIDIQIQAVYTPEQKAMVFAKRKRDSDEQLEKVKNSAH